MTPPIYTRTERGEVEKKSVKHLKILSLNGQRKTSRELCDEINTTMTNGATVSSRTVRRKLGEEGLVGRIAAKKPLLKEKNRVKRLKFAKEHNKWTKEDWYKVLWTDESKFEQFGNKRRVYGRGRDIKMSVSCQQLNTEGGVLLFGVPFQPQEQVT